jgi:hypothetical protein
VAADGDGDLVPLGQAVTDLLGRQQDLTRPRREVGGVAAADAARVPALEQGDRADPGDLGLATFQRDRLADPGGRPHRVDEVGGQGRGAGDGDVQRVLVAHLGRDGGAGAGHAGEDGGGERDPDQQ